MSLSISNLSFGYHGNKVLDNICFNVPEASILSILGPNGSGKTTLLKCINRILQPENGRVTYKNVDLHKVSLKELAGYISYVPQDHGSTFPISVIDTIMMGRIPHSRRKLTKQDKEIAFTILELMGLKEYAFKNINQISGGERQRVIIARAMAQEAPILLMDEPTSSLDIKNQLEILNLVKEIVHKNKMIAILTMHDINLAAMYSDMVIMLNDKKLFKAGTTEQVICEESIKTVYGVNTVVHNFPEDIFVRMLKPQIQ